VRTTLSGSIKAVAAQSHPLQTRLQLILTDFEPNGNKQGVPKEEAENIIRTALYQPLKINFSEAGFSGHVGAFPVGPITKAYSGRDGERDVIYGEAVIWNEHYQEVSEHLKAELEEGIGTSWEIYFEDSTKDDESNEWLHGCVFAGTCVVEVPAYGPERTRVLAIAEALGENDLNKKSESGASEDVLGLQEVLWKMYEGLDALYVEVRQAEKQEAAKELPELAEQFATRVRELTEAYAELKTTAETAKSEAEAAKAELNTAKSELDAVKAEAEQLKADKTQAELFITRSEQLETLGLAKDDVMSRKDFYLGMSDETFTQYVADLKTLGNKTAASLKLDSNGLPEPTGSKSGTSISEVAKALRGK
jgi:hypothetical protein